MQKASNTNYDLAWINPGTVGPTSTTDLPEGTNLYFTTARARSSLSAGIGISYDSTTGVINNSGVASASPAGLSGLVGWWKSDSLILNDGDPVSTWNDSSTSGFNLSQATPSARPTYRTNVLHGKPVVRFDGNDYLSIASGPNPTGNNWTIIALALSTSGANDQVIVSEDQASSRGWVFYTANSGITDFVFETNGTSGLAVNKPDNQWDVMVVRGGFSMWVGGNMVNMATRSINAHTAEFHMGRRNYSGAESYLTGDIAEVIIYNRALTNPELMFIHQYLNLKYNGIASPMFVSANPDSGYYGVGVAVPLYRWHVAGGVLAVTDSTAGVGTLRIQDAEITKASGSYFSWGTGIRLNAAAGRQLHFGVVTPVDTAKDYSIASSSTFNIYTNGYNSALACDLNQGTTFGGVAYLKPYAVASVPSPGTAGGMIFVSDESGGAVPAFSDGTNWRRVTDRAIIS